eukprot:SAG22_NODE_2750_length_2251_cov_1.424721_1_plen_21_part_10
MADEPEPETPGTAAAGDGAFP